MNVEPFVGKVLHCSADERGAAGWVGVVVALAPSLGGLDLADERCLERGRLVRLGAILVGFLGLVRLHGQEARRLGVVRRLAEEKVARQSRHVVQIAVPEFEFRDRARAHGRDPRIANRRVGIGPGEQRVVRRVVPAVPLAEHPEEGIAAIELAEASKHDLAVVGRLAK